MAALSLTDVLKATGGTVLGPSPELDFGEVSTDTRALTTGSLFVALRGPRFDGHDYLEAAARRGAAAAMVQDPLPQDAAPLPQIQVVDTLAALGRLAAYHVRRLPARRVAVTGSNGKTTTKELLRAALSAGGRTAASPLSFNNFVGVPLTLLGIGPEVDFAAIELGTNSPGEIGRLAELAAPEIGIVTNCSEAHIEKLGDLDGVVREKGALVEALPADGVAVLNADDPALESLRARARCRVVTFGVRQPADYRGVDIRFDLHRLRYRLDGERVFVPLGGCHNVYNTLAAVAAAEAVGIQRADAIRRLREIEGPPMRLSRIQTRSAQILDDCYNANPGSVEAAFRTLAAVPAPGRRVVVLGDMLELGERSAELHRGAGRWVSLLELGLLVAVGPHAEDVEAGARETGFPPERTLLFPDAEAAAAAVGDWLRPGDTVLVKGSRGMTLERVVEALQEVGERGAR